MAVKGFPLTFMLSNLQWNASHHFDFFCWSVQTSVSLCARAQRQTCRLTYKQSFNISEESEISSSVCAIGPVLWLDTQSHLCLANAALPCCCHGSSRYGKREILVSLRLHPVSCESSVKVANEHKQNWSPSILMIHPDAQLSHRSLYPQNSQNGVKLDFSAILMQHNSHCHSSG